MVLSSHLVPPRMRLHSLKLCMGWLVAGYGSARLCKYNLPMIGCLNQLLGLARAVQEAPLSLARLIWEKWLFPRGLARASAVSAPTRVKVGWPSEYSNNQSPSPFDLARTNHQPIMLTMHAPGLAPSCEPGSAGKPTNQVRKLS